MNELPPIGSHQRDELDAIGATLLGAGWKMSLLRRRGRWCAVLVPVGAAASTIKPAFGETPLEAARRLFCILEGNPGFATRVSSS